MKTGGNLKIQLLNETSGLQVPPSSSPAHPRASGLTIRLPRMGNTCFFPVLGTQASSPWRNSKIPVSEMLLAAALLGSTGQMSISLSPQREIKGRSLIKRSLFKRVSLTNFFLPGSALSRETE